MEVTPVTTTNEVPKSGERPDEGQRVPKFIHKFTMEMKGEGVINTDFVSLLEHWIMGMGEIYFISLLVQIKFRSIEGSVALAFVDKGASITEFEDIMGFNSVVSFGTNTMLKNVVQEKDMPIPAGYTTKIFPLTGHKPLSGLVIGAEDDVNALLTLTLTVDAMGPYLYRHSIDWKSGNVASKRGFLGGQVAIKGK